MNHVKDRFKPIFRGNAFLLLLFRAVNKKFGTSTAFGKSTSGLTRVTLFSELIQTLNPDYEPKNEENFAVYITKYLKGDPICSRSYYPFNDEDFQKEVQERFINQYNDALSAMNNFCRTYLNMPSEANKNDNTTIRRLVAGIIDIMLSDSTFDEDINTGHRTVKKNFLAQETNFVLQPFLLDVWHKLITGYSDKIDDGKINEEQKKQRWRDTYMQLTNDSGDNQPRILKPEIGKERAEQINVRVMDLNLEVPKEQILVKSPSEQYDFLQIADKEIENIASSKSMSYGGVKAEIMENVEMRKDMNEDDDRTQQKSSKFKETKEGDIKIAKNFVEFNNSVSGSTFHFN